MIWCSIIFYVRHPSLQRYQFIEEARGINVKDFTTAKLSDLASYFTRGLDATQSPEYVALMGVAVRPMIFPDNVTALISRCQDRIEDVEDIIGVLNITSLGTDAEWAVNGTSVSMGTVSEGKFPIKELLAIE